MIITNLLNSFKRLTVTEITRNSTTIRSVFTDSKLGFQVTPFLCAEPLKKKRRLDPAIVRAREDRRKKKIAKQIRRLEKNALQLKPIDELEIPSGLLEPGDLKIRKRNLPVLSEEEVDREFRLIKQWSRFRHQQALADFKTIDRLVHAQKRALDELRLESEELYQKAIQIDPELLPFTVKGPVITPPIPDYDSPDGDYVDISKKWS